MPLAPEVGTQTLTIDSVTVLGIRTLNIKPKRTIVDVTADEDTAVARFPTIKDVDFSAVLIYDPADGGQQDILDDYDSGDASVYVAVKGSRTFTITAYVQDVEISGDPASEQVMNVTFAPSGGAAIT